MIPFGSLRDKYHGETCWIVGKGPSLGFLRAEHFGSGPVIALNQAIMVVEKLDIQNPIYSLQKDGCGIRGPHTKCRERDGHDWMIRPERATLILQDTEGYSRDCLPDYEKKILVCPTKNLGFERKETMAIRMAIAIAKQMRCGHVKLLCCGSLVNGTTETYNVWTGKAEQTTAGRYYLPAKSGILMDLAGIPHSFFIPRGAR